mgnify:CR=1 FL=1
MTSNHKDSSLFKKLDKTLFIIKIKLLPLQP